MGTVFNKNGGGKVPFKYIGIFSNNTSTTMITVCDSKGEKLAQNLDVKKAGSYTFIGKDGLKIKIVPGTSNTVTITPPEGKALRYLSIHNGGYGGIITKAVGQAATTNSPVYGNVVLIGYV